MSHFFACCASQKTYRHARIARETLAQRAKTCDNIWYLGPLPTVQQPRIFKKFPGQNFLSSNLLKQLKFLKNKGLQYQWCRWIISWCDGFFNIILTSWFMFCFWLANAGFLFGRQNILLKNSLWVTLQAQIIFQCQAYQVEQLSLYIYVNGKTSLQCENSIFCSWELAFISRQAIAWRHIYNDPLYPTNDGIIGIKGKRSFWTKRPWEVWFLGAPAA